MLKSLDQNEARNFFSHSLEVEYREMTSQTKQKICHLSYGTLCHVPWTILGDRLGIRRKTVTAAFEVICGLSALPAPSFMTSQYQASACQRSSSAWPAHLDTHPGTWLGDCALTLWEPCHSWPVNDILGVIDKGRPHKSANFTPPSPLSTSGRTPFADVRKHGSEEISSLPLW